jgi:hypothetical protein
MYVVTNTRLTSPHFLLWYHVLFLMSHKHSVALLYYFMLLYFRALYQPNYVSQQQWWQLSACFIFIPRDPTHIFPHCQTSDLTSAYMLMQWPCRPSRWPCGFESRLERSCLSCVARPYDDLITRPRSPTVCRTSDQKTIMFALCSRESDAKLRYIYTRMYVHTNRTAYTVKTCFVLSSCEAAGFAITAALRCKLQSDCARRSWDEDQSLSSSYVTAVRPGLDKAAEIEERNAIQ